MIKYVDTLVVFKEIPNEITLAINISNCPCQCKGCHSSYLAEDIGEELTISVLQQLVENNPGITCVAFMGGDKEPSEVWRLAQAIKFLTGIKVAWYSGRENIPEKFQWRLFDYIKLGPYVEELGPLNSKTTNQKLFKIDKDKMNDITYEFWN